ncbi:MAG: orotidine 5'-phosphate decarboxylase [Thermoplasmata archaeon]|nr:orotidine 5'-phosphate decarboxylase [Thermoplasmata archaeon]
MAILQVALDLINAHRAIQIAKEAIEGGADWLEAGTPLIKAEGMEIVRKLRKFGKKIVADMKTIDVGAVEAEMAAKAGADVICILGLASDSTIREVVKAARRYGMEVMVDLMGIKDIEERVKKLEEIGVDYICVHTSIDEQMLGKNPFDLLERVVKITKLPVAIAGGINAETARKAVERGASIVIVGGAIIKAENVKEATQMIKKAMKGAKVKTELFKKYGEEEICEAFSKVSTCNICDAMHNKGAMRGIKAILENCHMVGRALTVKTMDGDWAKAVEAIDEAEKGEVIVIQAGEGKQAVWGELATLSAYKKGIAGIVIDGAVRDVHIIKEIGLPVFAKNVVAEAGEPKGYGEIGCEIVCGGQVVRKGDWIIGDDNGVVVVPKEIAQEIANRAINVMEKENRIREEIRRGSSLGKVLDLYKWEVKK